MLDLKNALTSMIGATVELEDTYQKIVEEIKSEIGDRNLLKSEIKDSLIAEIWQEIKDSVKIIRRKEVMMTKLQHLINRPKFFAVPECETSTYHQKTN